MLCVNHVHAWSINLRVCLLICQEFLLIKTNYRWHHMFLRIMGFCQGMSLQIPFDQILEKQGIQRKSHSNYRHDFVLKNFRKLEISWLGLVLSDTSDHVPFIYRLSQQILERPRRWKWKLILTSDAEIKSALLDFAGEFFCFKKKNWILFLTNHWNFVCFFSSLIFCFPKLVL